MRRRIGTHDEAADIAIQTELGYPVELLPAEPLHLPVQPVNAPEHGRKGLAQIEAAAAALADVEDAPLLFLQCGRIPKERLGRRGQSFAHPRYLPRLPNALVKRPACDFSARASVSNHSEISAKPSSRAVFAKPGYIWVYS